RRGGGVRHLGHRVQDGQRRRKQVVRAGRIGMIRDLGIQRHRRVAFARPRVQSREVRHRLDVTGKRGQVVFVRGGRVVVALRGVVDAGQDRKSTRLNSSHDQISYAVFCLKKKKKQKQTTTENRTNDAIDKHRRSRSACRI